MTRVTTSTSLLVTVTAGVGWDRSSVEAGYPVRRVMIPKANGVERPLGIPTIRDRDVQSAAKLVLEPIFEADFEDTAYGYRPRRSAVDAARKLHRNIVRG